jgi:hypothetical protein
MDPDNIIRTALSAIPSQDDGFFILEANPKKNEFRILQEVEAVKNNLECFIRNISSGFQFMGAFASEEKAQEMIDVIRRNLRDEKGTRLI